MPDDLEAKRRAKEAQEAARKARKAPREEPSYFLLLAQQMGLLGRPFFWSGPQNADFCLAVNIGGGGTPCANESPF